MSSFTKLATVGVLGLATLASQAQKGGKSAKVIEGTPTQEVAFYTAQTVGGGLTAMGEYTNGKYVFGGGLVQSPGCPSMGLEYAGRKFFERKAGSRVKFDFGATMGIAEQKNYFGATGGVFGDMSLRVNKHLSVKGKATATNAERGVLAGLAYTFGGRQPQ